MENLLQKAIELFKAADEERYQTLRESQQEAEKWKREDDMYGWNFHMGKAAGCNENSFVYRRVLNYLQEQQKLLEEQRAKKDVT